MRSSRLATLAAHLADVSDNHHDGGELRDLKRGEARVTVAADRVLLDLRPHIWRVGVVGFSSGVAIMLPLGLLMLGLGALLVSPVILIVAMLALLIAAHCARVIARLLTHWTRIELLATGGAIVTEYLPWRTLSIHLSEGEAETLEGSYDYRYSWAGRGLVFSDLRWYGCIAFQRDGFIKRIGGYVLPGAVHAVAVPLREATGIRFPLDDGPRPAELMEPKLRQRATVDIKLAPGQIEASIAGRPALRSVEQGSLWGSVIILVLFLGTSLVHPTWIIALYIPLLALVVWAAVRGNSSSDSDLLTITANEVLLERIRPSGKRSFVRQLPTSRITSVRATGEAYKVRLTAAYEGDSSVAFDLDDFTTVYYTANDRLRDEQARELADETRRLLGLTQAG